MHKRGQSRDEFGLAKEGLMKLRGKIGSHDLRLKAPTVPIYDSSNWPEEAVDGQLARDMNDLDSLWEYQVIDESWHQIGGADIHTALFASLEAFGGDVDYQEVNPNLGNHYMGASGSSIEIPPPTVTISGTTYKTIFRVLKNGTYLVVMGANIVIPNPSIPPGTAFGGFNFYQDLLVRSEVNGDFMGWGNVGANRDPFTLDSMPTWGMYEAKILLSVRNAPAIVVHRVRPTSAVNFHLSLTMMKLSSSSYLPI
jgi:hypothetical protein